MLLSHFETGENLNFSALVPKKNFENHWLRTSSIYNRSSRSIFTRKTVWNPNVYKNWTSLEKAITKVILFAPRVRHDMRSNLKIDWGPFPFLCIIAESSTFNQIIIAVVISKILIFYGVCVTVFLVRGKNSHNDHSWTVHHANANVVFKHVKKNRFLTTYISVLVPCDYSIFPRLKLLPQKQLSEIFRI